MRHVHDGELHAFLDGALDLLPEGRGEEVREHISNCPACRERLQDEEAVRSEAQDLLGNPDLSGVSLPTFEELRERAEALGSPPPSSQEVEEERKARYRGPLKGLPLAWAATIVLATGVGWMGGQIWRGLPSETLGPAFAPGEAYPVEMTGLEASSTSQSLSEAAEEEAGTPSAEAPAPDEVSDLNPGQVGSGEVQPAPSEVQPPTSPVERMREAPGRVKEPQAQIAEVTSSVAGEARASDTTTPGSQALQLEALVVSSSRESSPVPQNLVNASVAAGRTADPAALTVAQADAVTSNKAEDSALDVAGLGNTYAIPGLEVVSIEWEERVPGEKALLIRQLLAPGDTLELRVLGMLLGKEPAPATGREVTLPKEEAAVGRVYANVLEASLPPGWEQVVMERGRLLLVARGPLSEGNLKGLLKTLR